MKKYIIPIISCLIVGFSLAYFMLNQYDDKQNLKLVFGDDSAKLYFIQYGVFSTIESMEKNTISLSYYIYNIIDDKYYVFIGITKDENNLSKLKGYFKKKGYDIYVKEFNVNNKEFIDSLLQYDILLEKIDTEEGISAIINQVLEKYEELLNEH